MPSWHKSGHNTKLVSMATDLISIKDELVNFLRDKLNANDTKKRTVDQTTVFTATTGQTVYPLSPNALSFVRSVTVVSAVKKLERDYTIGWREPSNGSVVLAVAPTAGQAVTIIWGKQVGQDNFVYPDFPRKDIGKAAYPRIGFQVVDKPKVAGLGGGINYPLGHTFMVSIKVIDANTYFIDKTVRDILNAIKVNCKNFSNFRWIQPEPIGEYFNYEDDAGNILSKTIDFEIPDQYETVTYT